MKQSDIIDQSEPSFEESCPIKGHEIASTNSSSLTPNYYPDNFMNETGNYMSD